MTDSMALPAQPLTALPQLDTEMAVSGEAKVVNGNTLTSYTVSGVAP
jgi:hypothetical protein